MFDHMYSFKKNPESSNSKKLRKLVNESKVLMQLSGVVKESQYATQVTKPNLNSTNY